MGHCVDPPWLTMTLAQRSLGWHDAKKMDQAVHLAFGLGGLTLSFAFSRSICQEVSRHSRSSCSWLVPSSLHGRCPQGLSYFSTSLHVAARPLFGFCCRSELPPGVFLSGSCVHH